MEKLRCWLAMCFGLWLGYHLLNSFHLFNDQHSICMINYIRCQTGRANKIINPDQSFGCSEIWMHCYLWWVWSLSRPLILFWVSEWDWALVRVFARRSALPLEAIRPRSLTSTDRGQHSLRIVDWSGNIFKSLHIFDTFRTNIKSLSKEISLMQIFYSTWRFIAWPHWGRSADWIYLI